MATLKNGVFGGFSGKIGNVIGASWRDVWYIKLMPKNVYNPQTRAQMQQRKKFIDVIDVISPCAPILSYCWKKNAKGMSEFNAAVSWNLKNAFDENDELVYDSILYSLGPVTPAANVKLKTYTTENGRSIEFLWDDNTNYGWGHEDDIPLLICVDYDYGLYWWGIYPEYSRALSMVEIFVPALYPSNVQSKKTQPAEEYPAETIYCYMAFVSKEKKISNSVYAGNVDFSAPK